MSLLTELRIPHMGSVENAKMLNWLVAEGATFTAGQPLFEIETDKTVMEVEAESDGVLARCEAREGDEKKVGDRVGYVAPVRSGKGDIEAALKLLDAPAVTPAPALAATADGVTVAAPKSEGAARHSPLVKRLAAEHGVDLSLLQGSGPGGKVTGDDVLRAANAGGASAEGGGGAPSLPGYENVPAEFVANSTRRRAIARRLLESARNTATLTADMQIDLTAVFAARACLNKQRSAKGQPKVSVLAFVAEALCRVLRLHPEFNASFTDTHTVLWKPVHLGVAVDSPEGLVVPVIRDADKLTVGGLDETIRLLAQRARDGQLRPDELDGGTFTLSNPGSLGPVLRAEAVLNPPQVALLGLPAVLRVPVAIEQADGSFTVEVRQVLRPSLSFDHRALDGGQTIGFLNDLRRLLEQEPAQE